MLMLTTFFTIITKEKYMKLIKASPMYEIRKTTDVNYLGVAIPGINKTRGVPYNIEKRQFFIECQRGNF